jgi:hypothetical protein
VPFVQSGLPFGIFALPPRRQFSIAGVEAPIFVGFDTKDGSEKFAHSHADVSSDVFSTFYAGLLHGIEKKNAQLRA